MAFSSLAWKTQNLPQLLNMRAYMFMYIWSYAGIGWTAYAKHASINYLR